MARSRRQRLSAVQVACHTVSLVSRSVNRPRIGRKPVYGLQSHFLQYRKRQVSVKRACLRQRSIPRRGRAGGKRKGFCESLPPDQFILAAWRSSSRRVAWFSSWLVWCRRLVSRQTAQRIQRNQPASGGPGARLQPSSRVISLRQGRLNLRRSPDIYSTSGFLIRVHPIVKTVRLPQRQLRTDM